MKKVIYVCLLLFVFLILKGEMQVKAFEEAKGIELEYEYEGQDVYVIHRDEVDMETVKKQMSWGYSQTNMDYFLKNAKMSDEEIVIAVLDTGIDKDHPWLQGRIKEGGANCVGTLNGNCVEGDYYDDRIHLIQHGTAVSALIANITPNNVKILPIKVLDENGSTTGGGASALAGLDYVLALKKQGMNIKAINFSISTPKNKARVKEYNKRIEDLYENGVLFVKTSGNITTEDPSTDAGLVSTGYSEKAIVVSALQLEKGKLGFADKVAKYDSAVDFVAPGAKVQVPTVNHSETYIQTMGADGTSFAAPHITANIALLYSVCPSYSVEQIEKILKESAVDVKDTGSGKDDKTGYGYVDMKKAYEKINYKPTLSKPVKQTKVVKSFGGCGIGMTVSSFDPMTSLKRYLIVSKFGI